jgi:pyrroline-5-carboxylate reductase
MANEAHRADSTPPLLFVGGGNMCRAIVEGGIAAGVVRPNSVIVCEIDDAKRAEWTAKNVAAVSNVGEGMRLLAARESTAGAGHVLLAVKPQMVDGAAAALRASLDTGGVARTVVSILAGTRTEMLERLLGGRARVVRVMPNTPAQIRMGCSAVALGRSASTGDDAFTRTLFAALGRVVSLEERLFDAFTAVAGSGPAYVFYLAEAMTKAAVEQGIHEADADAIVRSVLHGSAALLAGETNKPAADLRAAVTSKGGTTAAAIAVMDAKGVMTAMSEAIAAGTKRGAELSRGSA